MRKRTQDNLFDNIMWYTIYLLPIIISIAFAVNSLQNFTYADYAQMMEDGIPISDLALSTILSDVMYDFPSSNIVDELFSSLCDILEFVPHGYIYYLSYFVTVYIFHLFVDFILFIPRLCHKWLKCFTQGE